MSWGGREGREVGSCSVGRWAGIASFGLGWFGRVLLCSCCLMKNPPLLTYLPRLGI